MVRGQNPDLSVERRTSLAVRRTIQGAARFSFAVLLTSVAACEATVLIGSECPSLTETCAAPPKEPFEPDRPNSDSGDDELSDADVDPSPSEAGMEAGARIEFQNPNFDQAAGFDGDLVVKDVIATFGQPILSAFPILNQLEYGELPGWYACWPLSVTTRSNVIEGVSRQMGDYLSFVPSTLPPATNFTAVRQNLSTPLTPNSQMHVMVEAIADDLDGAYPLSLAVLGTDEDCWGSTDGVELGRSERILKSTNWRPVCVTFETSSAYSVFMLRPIIEGAAFTGGALPRLLIDTVRQVASCP